MQLTLAEGNQKCVPSVYADKRKFCTVADGKLKTKKTSHALNNQVEHTATALRPQLPHTLAGMHTHAHQTPAHSHACTHAHVKAIGWAVERPFSWWRLLMATR